ncbi:MAG: hypothetical protein ACLQA5_09530 [Solirubrobacteraceae bacterium]
MFASGLSVNEEALQVGADVVVGVELRRGEHDLAKRTIDSVVLDLNDR